MVRSSLRRRTPLVALWYWVRSRIPVLAVVAGMPLLVFAPAAAAAIGETEDFDWSMPERLLVDGAASARYSGAPVPRYDPDALMIPAGGWAVTLDACNVTDAVIERYAWRVDGDPVGSTTECEFTHRFPAEGVYQVELGLTDNTGDTATLSQRVTVQDWLIVALGDSFASGEGNPDRPANIGRLSDFGDQLEALRERLDDVDDLDDIDELEEEIEQARRRAVRTYLDSLPTWTATAPAWGTAEPTYAEIVLDGAFPGDALRCHRSMVSGQARAALAIEIEDPRTSVTLVHLACSGGRIDRGLIGSDDGQPITGILSVLAEEVLGVDYDALRKRLNSLGKVPGQLEAARAAVRGREIDAIVISAGGNDIGFSDLIAECVAGEPCHDGAGPEATERFNRVLEDTIEALCTPVTWIERLTGASFGELGELFPASEACLDDYGDVGKPGGRAAEAFGKALERLPRRWRTLDEKISATFPGLDRARVYLTEYPDLTHEDVGVYCGWTPDLADPRYEQLPGITQPEWTWLDVTVQGKLRASIETATALYQWRFVTETGKGAATIDSESEPHGYCASDNWVVQLPESLVAQQQFLGAIHPNGAGQDNYQRALFNALTKDFYPAGGDEDGGNDAGDTSAPPRAPVSTATEPAADNDNSDDNLGIGGGSITWPMLLLLGVGVIARRVRRRPPRG